MLDCIPLFGIGVLVALWFLSPPSKENSRAFDVVRSCSRHMSPRIPGLRR
jgi:hypothetical protein